MTTVMCHDGEGNLVPVDVDALDNPCPTCGADAGDPCDPDYEVGEGAGNIRIELED